MANAKQIDFLLAANLRTSGNVNSSGYVYFYEDSGRTIQKDVYDSATKDNVLSQPVSIGVRGTADVFAEGTYWISIFDKSGTQVATIDNVNYQTSASFGGLWTDLANEYGRTASDLQDALDDIGSDNATILLRSGEYTIAADVTVSSNILLLFEYGAYVTVSSGITLTIEGDIQAPYYNIYRGTGTVTVSNKGDKKDIWSDSGADIGDNTVVDLDVTGSLDVTGAVGVDGDFDVATNKFTVASASGNTTIAGTLGIVGDLTINTNKFSVVASSGNTTIAGTLGVAGDLTINTNKFSVVASSGDTLIAGTLGITGITTVSTLTDGTATLNLGSLTGVTNLTVDNLNINGNTVSSTSGNINISPLAGTSVIVDGHFSFDGNTLSSLTDNNTVINAYGGKKVIIESVSLDGGTISGVTSTFSTLNIEGSTISAPSGDLEITPFGSNSVIIENHFNFNGSTLSSLTYNNTIISAYAGKNVTIESVTFDGGVVAGITSITDGTATLTGGAFTGLTSLTIDNININGAEITSDTGTIGFRDEDLTTTGGITGATLTGTLQTAAQTNITSLGTLTALQVDNLNLNGNTFSSTSGAVNITPLTGQNLNVSLSTTGDFVINTNQLYVDTSSGNVGIGTDSPSGSLDINNRIVLEERNDIATGAGQTYIFGTDGVASGIRPSESGHLFLQSRSSADRDIGFITGSTPLERMTITGGGKVGIGTSDPGAKLNVVGNILQDGTSNPTIIQKISANNGTAVWVMQDENGTAKYTVGYRDSQDHFAIGTTDIATNQRLVIDNSGNVGIGVTNPDTKLEIFTAGTQLKLRYDASNYSTFATGSGGDLTITPSGGDISLAGNVSISGGLDAGASGTSLKCKVINIGDWDMDADQSVSVAHGLTLSTIRTVQATIRDDTGSFFYPIIVVDSTGTPDDTGIQVITDTNVVLRRATGGGFDSIGFDSTSYNRGWITIWYEA